MAKIETPLLAFIRAIGTMEMKRRFAEECGTTLEYMYQIAGQAEPNPRLRLAMAIKERSAAWARTVRHRGLTFEDLLVPATVVEDEPAPLPEPVAPTLSTKPRVARRPKA